MLTKRTSFAAGYWAAQMVILLLEVFFFASPLHQQKIEPVFLWPAAIALLCLAWRAQCDGKPFPWDFFCLTAYIGWVYATCVLNKDPYLEINQHFMLVVLLGFGAAYPTFRLFDAQARQRWFNRFAALTVALLTAVGAVCLYCGLTDTLLPSPFCEDVLGLKYGRLYLFTLYPTEAACVFSLVFFLAAYLFAASKRLWQKLLLGVCGACQIACVVFTVSRTAMLCIGAGLGLLGFLAVYRRLEKRTPLMRLGASVLTMAVLAYGCVALQLSATDALARAMVTGREPVAAEEQAANTEPPAATEQPTAPVVSEPQPVPTVDPNLFPPNGGLLQMRSVSYDIGTLTGRTDLWRVGMQAIKERPVTLLIGMSDAEVSRLPQRALQRDTYHMHSVWMETLLLTGVPGLLLYLLMTVMLLAACVRLFFAKDVPISQNVLAVLPPVAILNGLMEIYPSYSGKPMDLLFFLAAGAVVAFDMDRRAARSPAPGTQDGKTGRKP